MPDRVEALGVDAASKQADVPSGYTGLLEYTKAVVTLASGLLAFSVVFAKEILQDPSRWTQGWLCACWIASVVSVLSGLMGLGVCRTDLEGLA